MTTLQKLLYQAPIEADTQVWFHITIQSVSVKLHMESQLEDCMEKQWQFRRHCELRQRILGQTALESSEESTKEAFDTFRDFVIGLCPTDDSLCDIFLKDFQDQKDLYEESMRSTSVRALVADHTFKVTGQTDILRVKCQSSLYI